MFDELNPYKNQGHFFFTKGDLLSEVSKDVPDLPGVYYILRLSHGHVDLVYIGKSGSLNQDGSFCNQLLRKDLNNKQNSIKHQAFFDQKMKAENIDALDIYWFVTLTKLTATWTDM